MSRNYPMVLRQYYTIYITKFLVDGRIYVGCHKTTYPHDSYLGSGVELIEAIETFGRENFVKYIYKVFDDKEEAMEEERRIVDKDFLKGNVFNLRPGGGGGEIEGAAEKIGKANRGKVRSEEFCENQRKRMLGDGNHFRGKHHTERQKQIWREWRKGKSFRENFHHTEESKRKMSEARRGVPNWGARGRKHSEELKKHWSEIRKGRKLTQSQIDSIKERNTGRVWICNVVLGENKFIDPQTTEYQILISNPCWKEGMLKKSEKIVDKSFLSCYI